MQVIELKGVVQGVGFRPSVARTAKRLSLVGFVRNDGSHVTVGVDIEPERMVNELLKDLGPMAKVESYTYHEGRWEDFGLPVEGPEGFSILRSKDGERDSSLPYDTAICPSCLEEMTDPSNRRYLHPFTNCTDCGARYTVIESLPYDRERTTMSPFEPCSDCSDEYGDMDLRRYHAQTLSCPADGPLYRYLDRDLSEVSSGWRAFLDSASRILKGDLFIVKGWGGMHIASGPESLEDLRRWYGRPYKPFAVMARDLNAVERICNLGPGSVHALTSPARPIVLLDKREDSDCNGSELLETASPGLSNIGVMLPYSGMHHLLFKALKESGSDLDILVMTSANPPGGPMAVDLESVFQLGAEGYLVHDREIAARCDDSVIVPDPFGPEDVVSSEGPFGIRSFPIRKARGMIPDPLDIPHSRTLLAAGAERNMTISVTRSGRCFTSPYIGNSRHPSVLEYAGASAERFMDLFGARPLEAVVVDKHPRYSSRRWGREIASDIDVVVLEVQHHHAHAVSLGVDSGVDEMGVVVVDGVGFGEDGIPWGAESLHLDGTEYRRVGHLQPFGLPGGDASVYHPERIAHWLSKEAGYDLDLGDDKLSSVLDRTHGTAVMTTSLGRVLDALSALFLGVTWRTYDGEPAMRLEGLLSRSRSPIMEPFGPGPSGSVVDLIGRWEVLLQEIERRTSVPLAPGCGIDADRGPDLAMGFVGSIVRDLAILAMGPGGKKDLENPVGISGGVAYDIPIVRHFVSIVRSRGGTPVLHSRVPPGDGGVSIGQAAIGGGSLDA